MQTGDLLAFLMLTGFLYEPIHKLHQLNQLVQAGRAAGERVFEIIDEPIEPGWDAGAGIADPGAVITDRGSIRVNGDVRFDDVGFSYGKEGAPALQHITLSRAPGRDDRARGNDGRGKIDARELADAVLRI